jgi:uncharacterized protein YchJ
MDQTALKDKMMSLMQKCACGSGKPGWQCCRAGEVKEIENEKCICGSGKMVIDCCMKNPETHKGV